MIAKESKAKFVLTDSRVARILRRFVQIEVIDIESIYGPRGSAQEQDSERESEYAKAGTEYNDDVITVDPYTPASLDAICYMDYNVSSTGILYGRAVSFREINKNCLKIKEHLLLLDQGARLLSIIEPFHGLGKSFNTV